MNKRGIQGIMVASIACVLLTTGCRAPEDGPLTEIVLALDYAGLDDARLEELKAAGQSDSEIQEWVQEKVMGVVDDRLRGMEIRKPQIEALDSHQLRVQYRSSANPNQVQKLVERTGKLRFHIVASPEETTAVLKKISETVPDGLGQFISIGEAWPRETIVGDDNLEAVKSIIASAHKQGLIPKDKDFLFSAPQKARDAKPHVPEYSVYLLDKEPNQTGDGIRGASVIPNPHNPPNWSILFSFDSTAGAHFGEVTQANINRKLAIVVDDTVMSAPTINQKITDSGQITGKFDQAEARELAIMLNSGPLPVPVRVVSLDVQKEDSPTKTD